MTATTAGDPTWWSPEELAAVQSDSLRRTLARCLTDHPRYAAQLRARELDRRPLQSIAELERLPLTTKSDFLNDPEAFRLRPVPGDTSDLLWDVMYTTGSTTGQPSPIYASATDHHAHLAAARREGRFIGLSSSDTVANLLPLTPFPMGAYARSASDAAAVGAAMIWCHTGRSEGRHDLHNSLDTALDLIRSHGATVLWGIASFVRRVLERAGETGVPLTTVTRALVTGEAVTDAMKGELAALMAAAGCAEQVVVNRYGATELGTSLYECAPGSGLHLLTPESVFLEVVDPLTGARLPDGTVGALAFTHLDRTGTVLLRYLLGDQTALSHEPCPHCGRTCPRLTVPPRRSAGLVKVKGTIVDLGRLHETVAAVAGVREAQVVVRHVREADPHSGDLLELRVAAEQAHQDELATVLTELTTRVAFVTPTISFASADDIFDPLGGPKARHVLDTRLTT